jgi:hypothetical protein
VSAVCIFPHALYKIIIITAQLSYGTSVGWISTVVVQLKSDATPLPSGPLKMSEIAIIGAVSCVGGFIASCIYGWVTNDSIEN